MKILVAALNRNLPDLQVTDEFCSFKKISLVHSCFICWLNKRDDFFWKHVYYTYAIFFCHVFLFPIIVAALLWLEHLFTTGLSLRAQIPCVILKTVNNQTTWKPHVMVLILFHCEFVKLLLWSYFWVGVSFMNERGFVDFEDVAVFRPIQSPMVPRCGPISERHRTRLAAAWLAVGLSAQEVLGCVSEGGLRRQRRTSLKTPVSCPP